MQECQEVWSATPSSAVERKCNACVCSVECVDKKCGVQQALTLWGELGAAPASIHRVQESVQGASV